MVLVVVVVVVVVVELVPAVLTVPLGGHIADWDFLRLADFLWNIQVNLFLREALNLEVRSLSSGVGDLHVYGRSDRRPGRRLGRRPGRMQKDDARGECCS